MSTTLPHAFVSAAAARGKLVRPPSRPVRCKQSITASAGKRGRHARVNRMKVAVVGCAHGELDMIYAALEETQRARDIKVELVICAGDFQAVRNTADLQCMACPPKFRHMRSFWKYYAGRAAAPVPTVFVGGNHEASNHLQEIPLGGLVAPNMYFLGNAGVINYRGVRIAGVSGVYTEHNYTKPRCEKPPYPRNQIKSVYHMRKEDVDRLLRVQRPVDIFVSHDWPRGITDHGDLNKLLAAKPFLRTEIANGSFGNPGTALLLDRLKPKFWFSAHIHVKFPALVKHQGCDTVTKFLALDKALPRRDFVQILDIPVEAGRAHGFEQFASVDAQAKQKDAQFPIFSDAEWLTILRTDAKEPQRTSAVAEAEIEETLQALQAHSFKPFVMPLSDCESSAPTHQPDRRPLRLADDVSLQPRAAQLFEALQLSAGAAAGAK